MATLTTRQRVQVQVCTCLYFLVDFLLLQIGNKSFSLVRAKATEMSALAQTVTSFVVSPAAEAPGALAFVARVGADALRCAAAHHIVTIVD